MATVETARGPVDTTELGVTLMHEHVFVLTLEAQENYPELAHWDEEVRVADAIEKLSAAAAVGVRTIVDPTVLGLGRYIPRIKRIAEAVPQINIIPATGAYSYHDVPMFFYFRGPGRELDAPEPMVDLFVKDITVGIADTGVKAAFLKAATEEPDLAPGVERILRAVAQAHRQTGVPITTHSAPRHRNGLLQQKVFKEEGVDLSRVVIGHSGDTTDADYLKELMDAGSFIGMDRFGIDLTPESAGDRVDIVARLCKDGYAGQMVLSHDASCHIDWLGTPDEVAAVLPNWNYTHIHRNVIPALREKGVDDKQIQQMLVDNPRRYFETAGSY